MTSKTKLAIAGVTVAALALVAWQVSNRDSPPEKSGVVADGANRQTPSGDDAPAAAPPSAISGVVSDEAGAPIAAIVQLSPLERGADPPTVIAASSDGRFAFEGLAAGSYRLSASQTTYLPALSNEIELAAGATERIDLMLVKGGSAVTGVISDISGGPIAAATVRLTPIAKILEVRRDRSRRRGDERRDRRASR